MVPPLFYDTVLLHAFWIPWYDLVCLLQPWRHVSTVLIVESFPKSPRSVKSSISNSSSGEEQGSVPPNARSAM